MPVHKGAKLLRVLTPITKKGTVVQHDEFGRKRYKETIVPVSKTSIRAFEHENSYRPKELRHELEIFENPDFIQGRLTSASPRVRNNPRPANEKPITPLVDVESLKAQLKREALEELAEEERLRKEQRNAADRARKAAQDKADKVSAEQTSIPVADESKTSPNDTESN